ncbi:MAG: chorismate mutase [Clostridia bacterium]|nr:chorismate mutase [Clostridia bacterium]
MLSRLRNEIDAIDKQILDLFEQRMDVAKQVGDYKNERGLPIFVPDREQAVIESRVAALKNPEYRDLTVDFFTDLMALSRRLQQKGSQDTLSFSPAVEKPRVAYLGRPGSNSAEALSHMFPDASVSTASESFDGIFKLLNNGEADYGVLPIENTSTGAITDVFDLLYRNNLYIVSEAFMKIEFVLAAPSGATLNSIRQVYSHPQGFLQCADFLGSLENLEEKTPLASTADSALFVAEEKDITKAAIVSPKAAELYGLVTLAENIQSSKGNTTRFVAVARQMEEHPGADKISIAFTLRHESGSLCKVLSAFSRHGLNLLYIESRPLPGRNFEYMFFTDFSGSLATQSVKEAMAEIKELSSSLQILGNYPSARE